MHIYMYIYVFIYLFMYKTLNPKPHALKAHLVASLDTKADGFKGNGLMYGSVRFLECIEVAYNIITYYISIVIIYIHMSYSLNS